MKRYGLLFLLSVGYALLLSFAFSTDYSRENSFLLQASGNEASGKAFSASSLAQGDLLSTRIHTQTASSAGRDLASIGEAQSPESADAD